MYIKKKIKFQHFFEEIFCKLYLLNPDPHHWFRKILKICVTDKKKYGYHRTGKLFLFKVFSSSKK